MPLPIWYLEFQEAHGRVPRVEELTLPQRHQLLPCVRENLAMAEWAAHRRRPGLTREEEYVAR